MANKTAAQRVTAHSHHLLELTLHRSFANAWLIRTEEPTDDCGRAALDTLEAVNLACLWGQLDRNTDPG